MNDLDWMIGVEEPPREPEFGTAWIITNIPIRSSSNVLKFLFNKGYTWGDGSVNIESYNLNITELSSVFDDNIKSKSITFTSDYDLGSTIGIAKNHSGEDKVYIYKWVDNSCEFVEIIRF